MLESSRIKKNKLFSSSVQDGSKIVWHGSTTQHDSSTQPVKRYSVLCYAACHGVSIRLKSAWSMMSPCRQPVTAHWPSISFTPCSSSSDETTQRSSSRRLGSRASCRPAAHRNKYRHVDPIVCSLHTQERPPKQNYPQHIPRDIASTACAHPRAMAQWPGPAAPANPTPVSPRRAARTRIGRI